MNPEAILNRATELGLKVDVRGDKLVVTPANRIPDDLMSELREHKPSLLLILAERGERGWQVPPPDGLPINPATPRPSPINRELVVLYLMRQVTRGGEALRKWLARRESDYFDGVGHAWDCGLHAYAAARDAACWQTSRDEAGLWELLQGLEDVTRNTQRGAKQ